MIDYEKLNKLHKAWEKAMPFTDEYPIETDLRKAEERSFYNGEFFILAYKLLPDILETLSELND